MPPSGFLYLEQKILTSSKACKALLGFGQRGLCQRAFINLVKDQYDVDVVGQCLGGDGSCSDLGGLFFLASPTPVLEPACRAGA
jgi:hypothetical protein